MVCPFEANSILEERKTEVQEKQTTLEQAAALLESRLEQTELSQQLLQSNTALFNMLTGNYYSVFDEVSSYSQQVYPVFSSILSKSAISDIVVYSSPSLQLSYLKMAPYQVMDYLLKPVDWGILERHVRELALKADQETRIAQVIQQYSHLFTDLAEKDLSPTGKKLVKYVHKNYHREISLSQLSVYSGLSENSICNLFKKELGITFLDLVYQLRIKKAMELLLADHSTTVRDVALKIGYSSERQFFRVFKSWTGFTPQQFRENYV